RIFREFAVVLTVAVTVSLLVSLTTTPMMCARLLKAKDQEKHSRFYMFTERIFERILAAYEWTLSRVLRHPFITLLVTLSTVVVTVWLYVIVPKGFFPQQDTGRLMGLIQADQDTSFQAMSVLLKRFSDQVLKDKDVTGADVFVGGNFGGALNSARMFVTLKPNGERTNTADQVMANLRKECRSIPGAQALFTSVQDLRIGGQTTATQYAYNLQGDNLDDLKFWAPQVMNKLKTIPGLVDVNSDQQDKGLSANLVVDRATAARLGISQSAIDNTLYDAFGQRQVSTMYTALNQYHVVMEADPTFWQSPEGLNYIYIAAPGGKQVPLSAIAHYAPMTTALGVNHSGFFPSITISFNLNPGVALGDAVPKIEQAEHEMGVPDTIHGNFAGTAQAYQTSTKNEPILIL